MERGDASDTKIAPNWSTGEAHGDHDEIRMAVEVETPILVREMPGNVK